LLHLFSFTATVHKSQGSEDPAGVIPLSTQHDPVLGRNLFDTGVTRGKQLVVLIGQPRSGVGGAHHEIAATTDPSLGPTVAALP
jgi:ATP-dependent exoDNAse (exonuclease V) alpha subunit